MAFVLFGHSYVRRLTGKRNAILELNVRGHAEFLHCYGEGGLSFERIQASKDRYMSKLYELNPRVLILDLGTNDLCKRKETPDVLCHKVQSFLKDIRSYGVNPDAIVLLPVLPRTGGMRDNQVFGNF